MVLRRPEASWRGTAEPYSTIVARAYRHRRRSRRLPAQRAREADAAAARSHRGRSRHRQRRARSTIRRSASASRAPSPTAAPIAASCSAAAVRASRSRRTRSPGRPRRAVQRSLHGAPLAPAQRRERPLDGRPHRRLRARRRDSRAVAEHAVRRRTAPAAARSRSPRPNAGPDNGHATDQPCWPTFWRRSRKPTRKSPRPSATSCTGRTAASS